ncbi:GNAT family N-acetyltransferase [Pontibacter diazotrophicus]|uniref:GNAT family N-acetyltransferase n=1 Tax=Pontibacter diazotrophicus TaxID=1400979 RepID=A0A3D8LC76_9BACT|nr:GNAT family N-acetyltransferase [Pontibacter diazotrophicus]RDV15000.1 GNAT family N-acetyltransferase [Pontibacter diazotrophicus]
MHVTIRKAASEDATAINNLAWQLGYTPTVEATAERIHAITADKTHCAFVAEASGEVIGWVQAFCAIRLESEPFVEIGGLVVDVNARGTGVGRKLVQQVMVWSAQQPVSKIRVRTNTTRLETHQFYQKFGFEENKEQKVYDLKL